MCQEKSSFTDIQTENMMFKCEIGILLPKQYEIGNKSDDFVRNRHSFAKTIRNW